MSVSRRPVVLALACLLSLAPTEGTPTASTTPATSSTTPATASTAPPRTPAAAGVVALTFDDGPSSLLTAAALDILKSKGARALFCVQGAHAKALPALVRRTLAEGHDLCAHSWTHPHTPTLDEVRQTGEALATWREILYLSGGSATGTPPAFYRFPYGQSVGYSDWWLGRFAMTRLRWDDATVSADWGCPGSGAVIDRVMAGVRPGSIILLHDANEVERCGVGQLQHYLPVLIDRLRAAGYELGRVVPSATYSAVNQSYAEVAPWPV